MHGGRAALGSGASSFVRRASAGELALLVAAVLGCVVYTALVFGGLTGEIQRVALHLDQLALAPPLALAAAAVLWRPEAPQWLLLALAWTALVAAAVVLVPRFAADPVAVAAPGALAVGALVAHRQPLIPVLVLFLLGGAFASLELYTHVPSGPLADLMLGSIWVGFGCAWALGRRPSPVLLSPGVLLLVIVGAASLAWVFASSDFQAELFGYRVSVWYLLSALAVALAVRTEELQGRAMQLFVVVAAGTAAYGVYRWQTGAGKREAINALVVNGKYILESADLGALSRLESIRPLGAAGNPQALGVWAAAVGAWSLVVALAPFGARLRLAALAIAIACGSLVHASGSRISLVALAAGGVTALMLFGVSRAFSGRRVAPLAGGVVALLAGGGSVAAISLADEGFTGQRFRGLLDPINDYSVQDRIGKWSSFLADMPEHPFGHGLSSTGIAYGRYGRFDTLGGFSPDSGFVQVVYQQGWVMLAVYALMLLALLGTLTAIALSASSRVEGTLAAGGCAALVSFVVALSAGQFQEGLVSLSVWVLVGLGLAPVVRRRAPT